MSRVLLLLLAAMAAAPASAQDLLHESDGRYVYRPAENGMLRLDTRTGQVSLCARQEAGWSCNAMPDERAAYEQEITRLQDENAAMRKALAERRDRTAEIIRPPAPIPEPKAEAPKTEEPKGTEPKREEPKADEQKNNEQKSVELKLRLPTQDEIDRMVAYVEKVWRRML